MAERPPIYRKMNKEQTKTQCQSKNICDSSRYPEPKPFEPEYQGETVVVNRAQNRREEEK